MGCGSGNTPSYSTTTLVSSAIIYNGVGPSCYTPTSSGGINGHLEGIDNEICTIENVLIKNLKSSYVNDIDGTFTFACFSLPLNPDLNDVIEAIGTAICDTQAMFTTLDCTDIEIVGAAATPSCYTSTDTTLCAHLIGIDTELCNIQSDIADLTSTTYTNTVINEIVSGCFAPAGGTSTHGAGSLFVTISNLVTPDQNVYYINGERIVVVDAVGLPLLANKDNYLDVGVDGIYDITPVNIGAPAPALAASHKRIYIYTTDGVGVTSVVDERCVAPIGTDRIQDLAVTTAKIANLSVTGAKMENIVAAAGPIDFATVTIDTKGRVTALSTKTNFVGLADNDLMQYDLASGKWQNVPPSSLTGLPVANDNETLRYDLGAGQWVASGLLINTTTNVGINTTNPQEKLTIGEENAIAIDMKRPIGLGSALVAAGALVAQAWFYAVSAIDGAGGETLVSAETTKTTAAPNLQIDLTWTAVQGAVSYQIYKGSSTGNLLLSRNVTTNSYSDIGAGGWGADVVPSVPTAYVIKFNSNGDSWFTGGGLAIGDATLDGSAIVELTSTTQGILIPRMTTVQRTGIGVPVEGLIVYDTDINDIYHYTGAVWQGTTTGSDGDWTVATNDIYSTVSGNVGIGLSSGFDAKLHIRAPGLTATDIAFKIDDGNAAPQTILKIRGDQFVYIGDRDQISGLAVGAGGLTADTETTPTARLQINPLPSGEALHILFNTVKVFGVSSPSSTEASIDMDGTDKLLNIANTANTVTFFNSAINPVAVGSNRDTIFINLKVGPITTNAAADAASLYVSDRAGAGTACLHIRNEENDVIKLFKGAALTAVAGGAANSGDAPTDLIIENNRNRINDIESRLTALGFL